MYIFLQQPNSYAENTLNYFKAIFKVSIYTYHISEYLCHCGICISPFNKHGIFNIFTEFRFSLLKESLGPFSFGFSVQKNHNL